MLARAWPGATKRPGGRGGVPGAPAPRGGPGPRGGRDAGEADEVVVLAACTGERPLAELARHTKMSTDVVTHILSKWQAQIPRSIPWTPAVTDGKLAKQSAVALDMLLEARAVESLAI